MMLVVNNDLPDDSNAEEDCSNGDTRAIIDAANSKLDQIQTIRELTRFANHVTKPKLTRIKGTDTQAM